MIFSFIIPAYNAAKTLNRCLNSVKSQTRSNWECIIVDDGSKDDTLNIIQEYSKNDLRIKVFTQQNLGPGQARNLAIDNATGDYVIFIDADDFITPDYLELLERYVPVADLVFIDVQQISSKGKSLNKEYISIYENLSRERILRNQMTGKIPWGGVRKVVKMSIIKNNQIRYQIGVKNGEEALFSFKVLLFADNISFLKEKPVYYYVIHEGSLSNSLLEDPWGEIVSEMKKYLIETNQYEKYVDTLNAFNITALVVSIDRLTRMYKRKELICKVNKRFFQFKQLYDYNHAIDMDSLIYKVKFLVPFVRLGFIFPVIVCSKLRKYIKI